MDEALVDAGVSIATEISVLSPHAHTAYITHPFAQFTRGFLVINAITLGLFLVASHVARVHPAWASLLGFGAQEQAEEEAEGRPELSSNEEHRKLRNDCSELRLRLDEVGNAHLKQK